MLYSPKNIAAMREDHAATEQRAQRLHEAYTVYNYRNPKALEYGTQGFPRRLITLRRCIENVFTILPPDRVELPTRDELTDAVISIQAFTFNLFGCADNLAWMWVLEANIKNAKGKPLSAGRIGLGKANECVRQSFPAPFQQHLATMDAWFDHLENYRHALAHRIPLYIPPYTIPTAEEDHYRDIQARKAATRDPAEYNQLTAEERAIAIFTPLIAHSFEERAAPVHFHPQMLTDLKTIVDIGRGVLNEIELLPR